MHILTKCTVQEAKSPVHGTYITINNGIHVTIKNRTYITVTEQNIHNNKRMIHNNRTEHT
jgi:hypothetical protein